MSANEWLITGSGEDLTVKCDHEIQKFSNSWQWIKQRIADVDYSLLKIGDYIPFTTTNNRVFNAQIAGIDTYYNYGIGSSKVGHHIDFITKELWPETFQMNKVDINNGTSSEKSVPWLASNGYLFVNSLAGQVPNSTTQPYEMVDVDYTVGGMYFYLPDEVKAVIKEKYIQIPTRYSGSGVLSNDNSISWTNIGKLWLPSEYEITGASLMTTIGMFSAGFVQYPIFAHNMNRIKYVQGTQNRHSWHTSSVYSGNSITTIMVRNLGMIVNVTASNANLCAPFCFRVTA